MHGICSTAGFQPPENRLPTCKSTFPVARLPFQSPILTCIISLVGDVLIILLEPLVSATNFRSYNLKSISKVNAFSSRALYSSQVIAKCMNRTLRVVASLLVTGKMWMSKRFGRVAADWLDKEVEEEGSDEEASRM